MTQDLLARRQYLAEQRRPRDEESLQHCTGKPVISAFAHSMHRSRDDLLAWYGPSCSWALYSTSTQSTVLLQDLK